MKHVMIVFNNKGLEVDRDEQESVARLVPATVSIHHLDYEDEKISVRLYLSDGDHSFHLPENLRAPWCAGWKETITENFDIEEAEKLALKDANGNRDNIVFVTLYPRGLLEAEEAIRLSKRGRENWCWHYYIDLNTKTLA